jgi:NADH:ubiquinone oxidoreductase subunit B-like Fe-S oxidoreductase
MIEDEKLKQKMLILLGQIEAICYPIIMGNCGGNGGYYDLVDSIKEQYVEILKQTIGYADD